METLSFGVELWAAGVSAFVSVAAVALSVYSLRRSSREQGHGNLDERYIGLYQNAMNFPFVVDPAFTWHYESQDLERRLVYECHAYQAWMICETIHDLVRAHPEMREVWLPVIDTEARLHARWILHPDRALTFRESYLAFLRERYEPRLEALRPAMAAA